MASMPFAQPRTDIDWELMRKLAVEDGVSITELAIRFNCSRSNISFHAKKHGWNIRRARTAAQLLSHAKNGTQLRRVSGHLLLTRGHEAVLTAFKAASLSSRLQFALAIQKIARKFNEMTAEQLIDKAKSFKSSVDAANILFSWTDAKQAGNGHLRPDLFALSPDQLAKLAAKEMDATPTAQLDE